MKNFSLTCVQWADEHFGAVDLSDCRRERRLVKVAAALVDQPSGSLPKALPKWKDLKAAYRLLDSPVMSFEKVLTPHWQQVRSACSRPGHYLLIEDTTLLDFSSHKQLQGAGRIGDDAGRGFNLHTTLALRVENEAADPLELSLVGLAGQHLWARGQELTRGEGVRKGYEPKKRKYSRARESERWGRVLAELPPPAEDNQRIYLADREGDIYELFLRCQSAGCDFVIRACQDRALLETQDSLFEAVAAPAELGRYTLSLRARPGTAARQATMGVRATRVKVRPPYRPNQKLAPRELWVVQAREINPPTRAQEIQWVLLTSLECATCEHAHRAIQLYTCRWLIEEYHKALKTGAGIEESQLQEAGRIAALLAILSLVAVRLLDLKLQAARSPQTPLATDQIEPEALQILAAEFGVPAGGWTQHNLWIHIARLGGFLARRSDGTPGWQTLWRGWNRLREMTHGAILTKNTCG
jgi:hypothetical protein